jgi:hypothetical protein
MHSLSNREDLAGEEQEGIKFGLPPPHPNLPPFSWFLHNIQNKNQKTKSRTKKAQEIRAIQAEVFAATGNQSMMAAA